MTLNNLSKKISLKFMNLRKPLEMVIFDKLFSKFILNTKNTKNFIEEFHDKGYAKLDLDIRNEIEVISNNLSNSKFHDVNKTRNFELNDQIIEAINNILNNKLKNTKYYLEKYFNSKIFPAFVCLRRNLHYEKDIISNELYSNNFHNDAYVLTHFKIFFNLIDLN